MCFEGWLHDVLCNIQLLTWGAVKFDDWPLLIERCGCGQALCHRIKLRRSFEHRSCSVFTPTFAYTCNRKPKRTTSWTCAHAGTSFSTAFVVLEAHAFALVRTCGWCHVCSRSPSSHVQIGEDFDQEAVGSGLWGYIITPALLRCQGHVTGQIFLLVFKSNVVMYHISDDLSKIIDTSCVCVQFCSSTERSL